MIHKIPKLYSIFVPLLPIAFCVIAGQSYADELVTDIPMIHDDKNLFTILAYATDPTADILWSAGTTGVADVQDAFNNARQIENTSLPMLTLPSQSEWDGMNDNQKALWLINKERSDRNALPLHGSEANVISVAQYYADYLLDNDVWGHTEDGKDPWARLETNAAIAACHDPLSVAENLAVFATSGSSIPLPIERSVYAWMYEDGDCCTWGHRHAILWTPYDNNSGPDSTEGFIGIGRSSGGPYKGPFDEYWPFVEIIVMNVFDPCSSWEYPVCSPACEHGTCTGLNICTCDSDYSGALCDQKQSFPWILFLPALR